MTKFYSQGRPKDPIRQVLRRLVGKSPPKFVRGYNYSNLTDVQHAQLQDWVGSNINNTVLYWSTAIGIIEAAENIVAEAVANANIPPEETNDD